VKIGLVDVEITGLTKILKKETAAKHRPNVARWVNNRETEAEHKKPAASRAG